MKNMVKRLLLSGLLVGMTLLPVSASAAGSAGIYASCSNGARGNVSGSGNITVTFYRLNASPIVKYINLGVGMSTTVYSGTSGSYSTVYANGNSSVSGAGCY